MRKKIYKVSIILPVYNGEKYLALAIESILQQTYSNFELIIIDDCSTDKSNQIAKSYMKIDSRIKVYKNKKNKKLPKTLNYGFHLAIGDLFTWTSDDNILKPEAIEEMVNVFEKKSDIDFVYADIIPIDTKGNIDKRYKKYLNGEIEDIYVFNPILACFLYKRKIHDKLGGYNPNLFLCEDYDFWIRTYEHGFYMYHLKKKIYFYRMHSDSLSVIKQKEHARLCLKILLRNLLKEKKANKKWKIVLEIIEYSKILCTR